MGSMDKSVDSEVTEIGKLLEVEPRACGLPGCVVIFKPRLDWQKYCCEDHSRKARALRRKQRVKEALALLKANRIEG